MSLSLNFLPEDSKKERVDVLLITGDAYIDHPSFGIAVIARVLASAGYSVAVLSQPEYFNPESLKQLPEPELFIGITAGNLDSIVANYTGNRNLRKKDSYSVKGEPFFPGGQKRRPDRATIVYSSYIKQRFKQVPVVLGGIEASLRRFAHFDYVQNKVRKSILLDAKADILVYAMGEKAVLEIARRCRAGEDLYGIRGTMVRYKKDSDPAGEKPLELPGWEEITSDKKKLLTATELVEKNMHPGAASNLVQNQGGESRVICFKPQPFLTQSELDDIYGLPFRKDYPPHCKEIPAWDMIKNSITSHRGCFGKCSFCAIASHQGPVIISRSSNSIIKEVSELSGKDFFKGTISDIGGPTANMYGCSCKIGWCKEPSCLFPEVCPQLVINGESYVSVLKKARDIKGIKHVFVSSGIRHDLALLKKAETEWIIRNATSGHFKIAPEHIAENVLSLMGKPGNALFIRFLEFFNLIKKKHKLSFYILPYIILSHPGSTEHDTRELGTFLMKHKIRLYQYQDFTPTPQTISTAMHYGAVSPRGKKIAVYTLSSKHNKQRKILEGILKNVRRR